MRIHRHISLIAATAIVAGAAVPVAGASDAQAPGGSGIVHHVAHSAYPPGARFVPERIWQEINDAMAIKLEYRQ